MFITMVIIGSALLTILVETLVFMTNREYRNRRFVLASVVVNATTNILLNLSFYLSGGEFELISFPVLTSECIVFITEFIANLMMAITLYILVRLFPSSPGLMFGLAAAVLFPGSLMQMLPNHGFIFNVAYLLAAISFGIAWWLCRKRKLCS